MIEQVLQSVFMGRVSPKLKNTFGYNDLQTGLDDIAEPIDYILRGDETVVNQCAAFIENAHKGTLSYNPQTHAYSVSGLDGPTATFEIFEENENTVPDLEDTLTLTNGAGVYTFQIPIPGRYAVVVWGNTKCATLIQEIS